MQSQAAELNAVLGELEVLPVTIEVMRATKIASSVNTMRKVLKSECSEGRRAAALNLFSPQPTQQLQPTDPGISLRAKQLVKAWKVMLKREAQQLQSAQAQDEVVQQNVVCVA